MKKIEFMFPELCNVFADSYNMEYLARCSNDIEIVETRLTDEPLFAREDVDMVYFACTTETGQEKALERLMQYKERIAELIDKGTVMLATGNAIEDFGLYIDCGNKRLEGLGIFDFHAERYMDRERHNSQFIASFDTGCDASFDTGCDTGCESGNDAECEPGNEITIIGHKSQFSFSYGDFEGCSMMNITDGVGMNEECRLEGLRRNNFFATYSLGPFLVLNPSFTKYLLKLLGLKDDLCFEKEAYDLYNYRLNELKLRAGLK